MTEHKDPVALLDVSAVHPDEDGVYHHEIISHERIPHGAELFLHPAPDQGATETGQPTELEMHRADYEYCRAAGFESPGELLAAYKPMGAEIEQLKKELEVLRTSHAGFLRVELAAERDTLREQVSPLTENVRVLSEVAKAGLEIGDQCSRGYLSEFHKKCRAALTAVKGQV